MHKLLARSQKPLSIAIVLMVLAGSLWVHFRAGVTLPNPWEDEAWNAWQAHAFSRNGTFHAPEINPERPIFAYGGGYAASLGVFFRVFGFSLEHGRFFNWLCMAGTWLVTAAMLRRLPLPWLTVPFAGWFFLSVSHTVAGNVIRPDALTLLLVTAGYWMLVERMPIKAIFLCGLGVIVHPNALYYLLGCLLYVLTGDQRRRVLRPTRGDLVVMVLVAIPVLASAIMILRTWEWFYHDFIVVGLRVNRAMGANRDWSGVWPWIGLFVALLTTSRMLRRPTAVWLLYGLISYLIQNLGSEMWYDIYKVTGFMALTTGGLMLVEDLRAFTTARLGGKPCESAACFASGAYAVAGALILVVAVNFNYRHGFVIGPRNYPQKLTWGWGMSMPDPAVPYFTDADADGLRELIREKALHISTPVVEVPHTGDSVLLAPVFGASARVLYRRYTQTPSDLIVFHLSRYIPPWVQRVILRGMERAGIDVDHPDYVRDGTEKWYVGISSRDTNAEPTAFPAHEIKGEGASALPEVR